MNFFSDAVSSCRNAIGSVVNYISKCQQSGIPFQIADEAMGESRTSYQKYWKGGINRSNNKFKTETVEHEDEDYTDINDRTFFSNQDKNKTKRNLKMRSAIVSKKIQNEDLQSGRQNRDSNPNRQNMKRKLSDHFTSTNEMSSTQDYTKSISQKRRKNNVNNDSLFMLETLSSIQNMLSENQATEEETQLQHFSFNSPREFITQTVRSQLIDRLLETCGDVSDSSFRACLDVLSGMYKRHSNVSNEYFSLSSVLSNKSWVSLSRPVYQECLGTDAEGNFVYNLGRMSFGMFQPSDLKCSVQSTHINIGLVHQRKYRYLSSSVSESDSDNPSNLTIETLTDNIIPAGLREEVLSLTTSSDDSGLYDYDIAVSLTIEPGNNNKKRLRALMSVKGYMLPDPKTPNRFTVWFTGGRLEPAILSPRYEIYRKSKRNDRYRRFDSNDDCNYAMEENERSGDFGNFKDWQSSFNHQTDNCNKNRKGGGISSWKEQARIIAAKLLLGAEISDKMEWNGAMSYKLHRPVGGHGKTYIDILHVDNDVLITRGNHGTIYVLASSAVPGRFAPITRNEIYSN